MIETKFATEQLERLSGLNFFPKPIKGDTASQAQFRELRLALECATSDTIAKRVVDAWVRESTNAPKPAELRRLVYAENEKAEQSDRAQYRPPPVVVPDCRRCGDTGVVESNSAGDVASTASLCGCGRGSAEFVEGLNRSRRKLAAIGMRGLTANSTKRGGLRMRTVAEVYNGDY